MLTHPNARLMGLLKSSKAKGTILTELRKIERMDLLILDDFGLHPFDANSKNEPLGCDRRQIWKEVNNHYSQIPVKEWYEVIGEKTVADAVLDRIVHQSLRGELYGESLRKQKLDEEYK